MKRSTHVAAPLLAATALALLTACKKDEMQRCVDEHDNVVADSYCEANNGQQRVEQRPDGHGGFFPVFIPMYRYYYGGMGDYTLGTRATGGSYAPLAGHSYGKVSRGGFGRSFSSRFGS